MQAGKITREILKDHMKDIAEVKTMCKNCRVQSTEHECTRCLSGLVKAKHSLHNIQSVLVGQLVPHLGLNL